MRPRFVVLWHEAGPALGKASHFDLLFEQGPSARTWCCDAEITPNTEQLAIELPRHRLHYFDYEGPISGDRGKVSRWDQGVIESTSNSEDHFEATIRGERLCGVIKLKRGATPAGDSLPCDTKWTLRYEPRFKPEI